MPVLPDWPASPWTVRWGRTSISTVILLVGGERPWLTPTETPGALYFPALSAVPLAAQTDAAADLLKRAGDGRFGAGPGDRQLTAPLALEAVTAHEDVAGHVELDVERRRQRRWLLVRGGDRRRLSGLAVGLDDLQH